MTAHTPTPWRVRPLTQFANARYAIDPVGGERLPIELHILICGGGPRSGEILYSVEQAKADAEFIVQACNSHEDLAEALRLMMRAYESLLPGVRHIAVQDYALLNDAPVAASRALAKVDAA